MLTINYERRLDPTTGKSRYITPSYFEGNTNGLRTAVSMFRSSEMNGWKATLTYGLVEITREDMEAINKGNCYSDRKEIVATCQAIIRRLKKEHTAARAVQDAKNAITRSENGIKRAIDKIEQAAALRREAFRDITDAMDIADITMEQNDALIAAYKAMFPLGAADLMGHLTRFLELRGLTEAPAAAA